MVLQSPVLFGHMDPRLPAAELLYSQLSQCYDDRTIRFDRKFAVCNLVHQPIQPGTPRVSSQSSGEAFSLGFSKEIIEELLTGFSGLEFKYSEYWVQKLYLHTINTNST